MNNIETINKVLKDVSKKVVRIRIWYSHVEEGKAFPDDQGVMGYII